MIDKHYVEEKFTVGDEAIYSEDGCSGRVRIIMIGRAVMLSSMPAASNSQYIEVRVEALEMISGRGVFRDIAEGHEWTVQTILEKGYAAYNAWRLEKIDA